LIDLMHLPELKDQPGPFRLVIGDVETL